MAYTDSIWAWRRWARMVLRFGWLFALLAPQLAGAASLGAATVESMQNGRFSIAIPIVSLQGEAKPSEAGVSGGGLCDDRACQEVRGQLERMGGGTVWILRVDGRALPGMQYAEFQAWMTWDGDGRQRGYVRQYKVALPTAFADGQQSGGSSVAPASVAASADPEMELTRLVSDWAAAWSRKDMDSYLGFYAGDFDTPRGLTREDWEKERHQRIARRNGDVQVICLNLRVEMETGDRAKALCRQQYRSVTFASVGNKTLWLAKRPGGWRIVRETMDGEQRIGQTND